MRSPIAVTFEGSSLIVRRDGQQIEGFMFSDPAPVITDISVTDAAGVAPVIFYKRDGRPVQRICVLGAGERLHVGVERPVIERGRRAWPFYAR